MNYTPAPQHHPVWNTLLLLDQAASGVIGQTRTMQASLASGYHRNSSEGMLWSFCQSAQVHLAECRNHVQSARRLLGNSLLYSNDPPSHLVVHEILKAGDYLQRGLDLLAKAMLYEMDIHRVTLANSPERETI